MERLAFDLRRTTGGLMDGGIQRMAGSSDAELRYPLHEQRSSRMKQAVAA